LENYCEMDWEKDFEASLLKAVYQNGLYRLRCLSTAGFKYRL